MIAATSATGHPHAPQLPSGYLPRPRLLQALLPGEFHLRLLRAPAGSGKSCILRGCANLCPPDTKLHWIELRGQPTKPEAFLSLLAASLDIEQADLHFIQAHLAQQQTPLWLMLDDLPHQADAPFDSLFNRLLQTSSPHVSWWVSSRRRPGLHLERLLLEGELLELGAAELALDASELKSVLVQHAGEWSPTAVVDLLKQTHGWYAGVRLHLFACKAGALFDDKDHRYLIQSYLERELLDLLSPEYRQALCALACLPSCDAALCEHLTEVPNGAHLLYQLYEQGAFIEPLIGSEGRYRVHPAVAGVLASWLTENARKALYRRACQYFFAEQQIREAIEYALLAEQPEVAASMLEGFTQDRLLEGRGLALVIALRNELPAELMISTPRLSILNSWALLLSGRLEEAERCIGRLQRFLPQPTAQRQRELLAQWQALAGQIAYCRGNTSAHRQLVVDALAFLPERAWAQRLMISASIIELAQVDGCKDDARLLSRNAIKSARARGSRILEGYLTLQHVQLLEMRGELQRAEAILSRLEVELGGEPSPLRGRVQLRRANIFSYQGRSVEATNGFQSGLQECLDCEDPAAIWGYLGLAELDSNGDLPTAFLRLTETERVMECRQITEPLYLTLLAMSRARLWLKQGHHERAGRALAMCLQGYQGSSVHRPFYGAPELAQRLDLLRARTSLVSGQDVAARLMDLLQRAQTRGQRLLECEILFGLAESHQSRGRLRQARAALLDGLGLARKLGVAGIELRCFPANMASAAWTSEIDHEEADHANLVKAPLSRREASVLQLIAMGLTNQNIAERLHISLHTVKSHAQKINVKLGVSRRTQAIVRAKAIGIVS